MKTSCNQERKNKNSWSWLLEKQRRFNLLSHSLNMLNDLCGKLPINFLTRIIIFFTWLANFFHMSSRHNFSLRNRYLWGRTNVRKKPVGLFALPMALTKKSTQWLSRFLKLFTVENLCWSFYLFRFFFSSTPVMLSFAKEEESDDGLQTYPNSRASVASSGIVVRTQTWCEHITQAWNVPITELESLDERVQVSDWMLSCLLPET